MSSSAARVLVVDDSRTARRALVALVAAAGGLEVAGEAADGREAVELVRALRPDVVAMDIRMPVMDGYQATRAIMSEVPTPVVMISGAGPAEVRASFDALAAGAVCVMAKPSVGAPSGGEDLVRTLRAMAGLRLVRRNGSSSISQPGGLSPSVKAGRRRVEIVGIAASTGGPSALATLLGGLIAPPPVPIVVVQHISPGFEGGLASWLAGVTGRTVRIARDGLPLVAGEIVVAPPCGHLKVESGLRARVVAGPERDGHRPSASHLFESLAAVAGDAAAAVVLTGLGRDGADGVAAIVAAGGLVIAQDGESAVADGMPGAVRTAGMADYIAPPGRIGALLERTWAPASSANCDPGVKPPETYGSNVKLWPPDADPMAQ